MTFEYPAMIYKNSRTNVFCASCIQKNLKGFGKTEEDALSNLKESFSEPEKAKLVLKPCYGFSIG